AVAAVLSSFIGLATSALAQNTSAEGSVILPVPESLFRGVIGRKGSASKPAFPKGMTAPKGAPNILLILTDDTGFGASGTFGGPIPTPTLDRVAARGPRYTHFYNPSLCPHT